MKGRRITLKQFYSDERQPGDYCGPIKSDEAPEGAWYICDPFGRVGRLTDHAVTEHEDGTITVEPSILDTDGYHGFLRRGEWTGV